MRLFYGVNGVTLCLQRLDGFFGVLKIEPFDTLFRTESGLVNLLIRRAAAYSAKDDPLYAHGVCGAEHGADIMLAADIIQNNHQRQFIGLAVLVYIHAPHFGGCQFVAHNTKGK